MTTRHSYTARKKLEVVEFAEQVGNRAASRRYQGISETCIRNWRKIKARLLSLNGSVRAERGRLSVVPVVEKELLEWINQVQQSGEAVDFVDLMVRARLVVRNASDCSRFKASRSWLHRFIKRHSLALLFRKQANRRSSNMTENVKSSSEPQLKCTYCDASFSCVDHLVEHIDVHKALNNMEPCVCEYCGKSFVAKSSLKTHLVVHTGEKPHKCNLCGKSYKFISSLMTHIGTHTKPYECDACGKHFSDPYLRKRHMKVHLKDKKSTRSEAQADDSSVHLGHSYDVREKLYCCDICAKSFTTVNMLIRHMASHSIKGKDIHGTSRKCGDEISTEATNCVEIKEEMIEDVSNTKESLEMAELIDQIIDMQTSTDLCQFSPSKTSAAHEFASGRLRTDSVDKLGVDKETFKCELCGSAFNLLNNLKKHVLMMHVGEGDQFKCNLCEKIFSNFQEFVTHMKNYVMNRVFPCNLCKKYFDSNSHLQQHVCSCVRRQKKTKNKCPKCLKSFKFHFALKNHKCRSQLGHGSLSRGKTSKLIEAEKPKVIDFNKNLQDINSNEQSVSVGEKCLDDETTELEEVAVESNIVPSVLLETIATVDVAGKIATTVVSENGAHVNSQEEDSRLGSVSSFREETMQKGYVQCKEMPRNPTIDSESTDCREKAQGRSESSELTPSFETNSEATVKERRKEGNSCLKFSREPFDPFEVFGNLDHVDGPDERLSRHSLNVWDNFKAHLSIDETQVPFPPNSQPDSVVNRSIVKHRKAFVAKGIREKQYECDECGRSFRLKIALMKHKCIHRESAEPASNELPSQRSVRIKELRSTGHRRQSCFCCTFSDSHTDKEHVDKPIHVCGICKKTFNSTSGLKRHARHKHSKQMCTSSALNAVEHCKNRSISGHFTKFISKLPSEKSSFSTKPPSSHSESSAIGLQSQIVLERNQLFKEVNEKRHANFLFNYSYDERPFGCGLCQEVFRSKDETLDHFFKCISLNC